MAGSERRVVVVGLWVEALLGHTELGKEEMTPPPKPSPASNVLVSTDATVAWLPLEDGPMPVAMETKEKGMPEDVQVDEPEDMGAMSAEEAGDTVGCGKKNFLVRRSRTDPNESTLNIIIIVVCIIIITSTDTDLCWTT